MVIAHKNFRELHKYAYKCVCLRVYISIMVMCDASDIMGYDRRSIRAV